MVDMCYKNPTSKNLEKLPGGLLSKDWEIYVDNISYSTDTSTVGELLNWEVSGKFESVRLSIKESN